VLAACGCILTYGPNNFAARNTAPAVGAGETGIVNYI